MGQVHAREQETACDFFQRQNHQFALGPGELHGLQPAAAWTDDNEVPQAHLV
jgi:hypothetical protein